MESYSNDELKHLEIPLEAIKLATNNFDETHVIGHGGYGKVYKGELLLSEGLTMVALKRLDRKYGHGDEEFFKEIEVLSRYRHENLVSLLGFCIGSDEVILVYENMSYGSLDEHLSSSDLSWIQRLRICIGAARGLNYLHDPSSTQQPIIHCDIKSANVLLDQNWNAKVTDFGLSKIGPANSNQQHSLLITSALGTPGYCDPLFLETYQLTKESDVYSFGVVLFEVLCGRLCVSNGQIRFYVPFWIKCYEENKLQEIISNSILEQISPDCLERFSGIAYQCLSRLRENRPSMAEVVRELEVALQYQKEHEDRNEKQVARHEEESDTEEDDFWETKLPQGWRAMINMFNIPKAIYTIKREFFSYLDKGVLFDEGNKLLWINNDGKKSVLISAKRFLELDEGYDHRWVFHNSYARFPVVADYHYGKWHEIRCQIKTSILSLGTMYAASLIFKYSKKSNTELKHLKLMSIKWKTKDVSVFSTHNAELTRDSWYKIRMWNFLNHEPNADFDIVLEKLSYYDDPVESGLLIQGIEFKALETIQREEIKGVTSIPISHKEDADEDLYWKKKLPNNYQEYIQILDEPLLTSNEKELYLLFFGGFLACHGKLWFSLRKSTRGICTMLPATHVLSKDTSFEHIETLPLSESRFKKVKVLGNDDWYLFTCRLRAYMFSTHYNYACYLVFKFEENRLQSNDTRFFKSEYRLGDTVQGTVLAHLNLSPPVDIPIIEVKSELGSHDSSNIQRFGGFGKTEGHIPDVVNSWMEERNDGWMEVRLTKPLHHLENHVSLEIKLWKSEGGSLSGIIVEGIEFRPMQTPSQV